MQKIVSYIYPNRVDVVSDTGYFPVEFRQVYQRTINIYQGIDNTIEFDIKNAQQKRINISNLNINMVIMDEENQEVYTAPVIPIPQKTGLASCTIPAIELSMIGPQLLKYSLYISDGSIRKPIYADAQYGMIGRINLIDGVVPEASPPIIIDTFMMAFGHDSTERYKIYTSESAEINPTNDYVSAQQITLDFITNKLDADITVQITDFAVVSSTTLWQDIEHFSVANTTTRVYKTYNHIIDYSNNVSWLRVKYVPKYQSTGSIEKIIVKR